MDSLGWTNTYYLALMTGHHPNGIFMAPGGKYQALDSEAFSGFLESHRTGILVLWDGSRFAEKFAVKNSRAEFSPTSHGLSLEEAGRIDDIAVLRYELSDTVTAGRHPA